MNMALKDKIQEDLKRRNVTPRSFLKTCKNSINGLKSYAKEGKSIIFYMIGVIVEIIMGFLFNINGLEWILIVCILGIMLAVELLNTAIESACDAITKDYNSLIKNAKDCGSAATFVICIVAIILNIIIFLPKIMILF